MNYEEISQMLGDEAESLLSHHCTKIPSTLLTQPSSDFVLSVFRDTDRSSAVIANLQRLYGHGRLAGSGYLSIFPVDQAMEHTAAFSFYHQPIYFDPTKIVEMAIEAGCSAVTSSYGALAMTAKKYAEQIPFILKLNHSEHLTLPEKVDQLLFAGLQRAISLGVRGVGATIYFGAETSHKQIEQIAKLFDAAHQNGLFTILWCYPRNPNYTNEQGKNYEDAVDITAQAIHIGATLGADIVKQKMPTSLRGFKDLNFSKFSDEMYERLLTDHPIDLVRYQVLHAFSGKIGLINSGGESTSVNNLREAVRSAVINKRAGGQGLIMGRKVFKRSWEEGIQILHAVQDVYLEPRIAIA